ncbi:MAG: hypothetical protein N2C14_27530 [Planctomycetales bacterium]
MPAVLKDFGEAFYQWKPKTADVEDVMEAAVANWLKQQSDSAGLGNTIELVRPGDRFDTGRHSPVERGGGTVAAIHGWIVLRDNGKVYSKALVTVG